jgi:hypothetical protein
MRLVPIQAGKWAGGQIQRSKSISALFAPTPAVCTLTLAGVENIHLRVLVPADMLPRLI